MIALLKALFAQTEREVSQPIHDNYMVIKPEFSCIAQTIMRDLKVGGWTWKRSNGDYYSYNDFKKEGVPYVIRAYGDGSFCIVGVRIAFSSEEKEIISRNLRNILERREREQHAARVAELFPHCKQS